MFGSSASSASPLVSSANVSPWRGKPASGLRPTMFGLPCGGTVTKDAPVSQLSSSIIARARSRALSRTRVVWVAVLSSGKSSASLAATTTVFVFSSGVSARATIVRTAWAPGARVPSAHVTVCPAAVQPAPGDERHPGRERVRRDDAGRGVRADVPHRDRVGHVGADADGVGVVGLRHGQVVPAPHVGRHEREVVALVRVDLVGLDGRGILDRAARWSACRRS